MTTTGRYSPLRYPGGKGKLANFVADIIRLNKIGDCLYVEPYAGGAAIAWELLLTGLVKRVAVNDLNIPVYSFWRAVLNDTDELCKRIFECSVDLEARDRAKMIHNSPENFDYIDLGFSFFFLNRTHRSGIINGGVIGGREQKGKWKIDARFNKNELISRIQRIAEMGDRVQLSNKDAVEFIRTEARSWPRKTLVYIDPPYFKKGRQLYQDFYKPGDHASVANTVKDLSNVNWIVSYDDVYPIHELYNGLSTLQYSIGYSARNVERGQEAMFFSPNLRIPEVCRSMQEVTRTLAYV